MALNASSHVYSDDFQVRINNAQKADVDLAAPVTSWRSSLLSGAFNCIRGATAGVGLLLGPHRHNW
jgi:hypothetical protein